MPAQRIVSVTIPLRKLAIISQYTTCLIQNVNQRLRVIPGKATDDVVRVSARENLLKQGGKFIWDKLASDEAFKCWSVTR